jgi:hypothetical protein
LPDGHSVYELDEGLLLVFKPRGHLEPRHAHAHGQVLHVVRGRLRVDTASATLILDPRAAPLLLRAGEEHATEALEATWLIAETTA